MFCGNRNEMFNNVINKFKKQAQKYYILYD